MSKILIFLSFIGLLWLGCDADSASEKAREKVQYTAVPLPKDVPPLSTKVWNENMKKCLQAQEQGKEKRNLRHLMQCLSSGLREKFSPFAPYEGDAFFREEREAYKQEIFKDQSPLPYTYSSLYADHSKKCSLINNTKIKIYRFAPDAPLKESLLTLCMNERYCQEQRRLYNGQGRYIITTPSVVKSIVANAGALSFDESAYPKLLSEDSLMNGCHYAQDFWALENGAFAKSLESADSLRVTISDFGAKCSFDAGIDARFNLASSRDEEALSFIIIEEHRGWNGWCKVGE